MDREDVVELTAKCQDIAQAWKLTADRLWEETLKNRVQKKSGVKQYERELVDAEIHN
jgi:hypothetical protein